MIYVDLECLIGKIDGCKPQQMQLNKLHQVLQWLFKSIENKHDLYRGKDCMETFCYYLREHTIEIINFKKKKLSY